MVAVQLPAVASSEETSIRLLIDQLIEWVVSAEHGIWNYDLIEIRRSAVTTTSNINNSSRSSSSSSTVSHLGVFAKVNIEPNETLMHIPRERYIHVMDDSLLPTNLDDDDHDDTIMANQRGFKNYYTNICRLATKLQQELVLDSMSYYAPYIAYLKQQPPGQLPATWSKAGRDRLRQILPKSNHDVVDWIDVHYGFCNTADQHTIAMTVQRCYDVALIPLWDMVNHDNGKVNVNTTSWNDSNGIRVYASQPILAGQEIYATYDKCHDCADVSTYWGTTEILRDFGFVESYPQRWTWDDEDVWFELHRKNEPTNNHSGPIISVQWDDHYGRIPRKYDYYGPLEGDRLEFVRQELDRLHRLELLDDECNATPHECHVIQQYHEAILTALTMAVAASEQADQNKDEL